MRAPFGAASSRLAPPSRCVVVSNAGSRECRKGRRQSLAKNARTSRHLPDSPTSSIQYTNEVKIRTNKGLGPQESIDGPVVLTSDSYGPLSLFERATSRARAGRPALCGYAVRHWTSVQRHRTVRAYRVNKIIRRPLLPIRFCGVRSTKITPHPMGRQILSMASQC